MHRNDRLWSGGDGRFHQGGIHGEICSSTSTKTGVAPQRLMASTVAINVLGTVMTSSPWPIRQGQTGTAREPRSRCRRRWRACIGRTRQTVLRIAPQRGRRKRRWHSIPSRRASFNLFRYGLVLHLEIEKRHFHFVTPLSSDF